MVAGKRLDKLAITDDLTGLFNMRHTNECLTMEFKRAARYQLQLGVILVDLDNLKDLNEDESYDFGSYIIGQVGRDINSLIRELDIAGRYGGDEFIVIVPETSEEGVLCLAQRIEEFIRGKEYHNGKNKTRITISQGISFFSPTCCFPLHINHLLAVHKYQKTLSKQLLKQWVELHLI